MALRILLADDHPVVSAAVADRLHTQTGWEICGTVTSATALLNSVATLRPDVVVTDYHMPRSRKAAGTVCACWAHCAGAIRRWP